MPLLSLRRPHSPPWDFSMGPEVLAPACFLLLFSLTGFLAKKPPWFPSLHPPKSVGCHILTPFLSTLCPLAQSLLDTIAYLYYSSPLWNESLMKTDMVYCSHGSVPSACTQQGLHKYLLNEWACDQPPWNPANWGILPLVSGTDLPRIIWVGLLRMKQVYTDSRSGTVIKYSNRQAGDLIQKSAVQGNRPKGTSTD